MRFRSTRAWLWMLMALCPAHALFAGDISWSGLYRFEGVQIHNSEVDDRGMEKSYGLHHLILRPQIVAADGLLIRSRFDVFNSAAYPNSQLGQFLGSGPRGPSGLGANQTTGAQNSNVLSNVQASDTIAVNELYLTWVNEFGSLVVGRAPLQFGLGMSYSAGNGEFDHWFDNRDMVGYKMVFGNMFLMPMIGKMHEGMRNSPQDFSTGGDLGHEDDVNDILIHFEYDNAETGTKLGVFHLSRTATMTGSDAPVGVAIDGTIGGATGFNRRDSQFKLSQTNLFLSREFTEFKFAAEGAFTSGSLGVRTDNRDNASEIGISGFGIATETTYQPQGSRFKFDLKAGFATGDQAGTDDRMEGFYFNRNYEVAELMFNHPLGNYDLLRTLAQRGSYLYDFGTTTGRHLTGSQVVDTESLSNVWYLSPSVSRKLSETWSADARLTFAQLESGPLKDASVEKNLGFELDLGGTYKPYDRLTWRSGAAVLFPGSAFNGGSRGFESKFAWGLTTKAAIRF